MRGDPLGHPRPRQDRPHLRPGPRAGAGRRARRGRLAQRRSASAFARSTARGGVRLVRRAARRPASTRSTSPRRTRCTSSTPGGARGRQARAVREAADPRGPPTPRSCSRWRPRTTGCSWRRCGRPATRWSARVQRGSARAFGRRATCTPSSASSSTPTRGPAARPGAGRRGAAGHGHLPLDLRPPAARRGREPHATGGAVRVGHRPRHRARRPLPGRHRRHPDRIDDLVVLARSPRSRPTGAASRSRTSTTRRTRCTPRAAAWSRCASSAPSR